MTPLGWLLNRKAWKGREQVSKAFENYYESGSWKEGSAFVQARYQGVCTHHNMSPKTHGKTEVPIVFAITVNTINTLFYLLMHVFSDDILLAQLRHEIEANAVRVVSAGTNEEVTRTLDLHGLRQCRLLNSAMHEVLRIYTKGVHTRPSHGRYDDP